MEQDNLGLTVHSIQPDKNNMQSGVVASYKAGMPQPKGPPRITAPQTLVLPSDNRKQRHLQGGPAFVSYWVARASQASIPDSFFPLS